MSESHPHENAAPGFERQVGNTPGPDRRALLEHLRAWGAADTGHSQNSLLDHLLRTSQILDRWSSARWVCDAGLFHSIYGTEMFPTKLISIHERSRLRALIGKKAEKLVYGFSVISRSALFEEFRKGKVPVAIVSRLTPRRLFLAPERMRELCCMLAANWLEQAPRMPPHRRKIGLLDYAALCSLLPPVARQEVETTIADLSG